MGVSSGWCSAAEGVGSFHGDRAVNTPSHPLPDEEGIGRWVRAARPKANCVRDIADVACLAQLVSLDVRDVEIVI